MNVKKRTNRFMRFFDIWTIKVESSIKEIIDMLAIAFGREMPYDAASKTKYVAEAEKHVVKKATLEASSFAEPVLIHFLYTYRKRGVRLLNTLLEKAGVNSAGSIKSETLLIRVLLAEDGAMLAVYDIVHNPGSRKDRLFLVRNPSAKLRYDHRFLCNQYALSKVSYTDTALYFDKYNPRAVIMLNNTDCTPIMKLLPPAGSKLNTHFKR